LALFPYAVFQVSKNTIDSLKPCLRVPPKACSVRVLLIETTAKEGRIKVGAVWAKRDATPGRAGEGSSGSDNWDDGSFLHAQLSLLDLTTAGLWLLDSNGVTRWANEPAGELIGIACADLMGEHVSRFIADTDATLGGDYHAEFKVTRGDGTTVWLAATGRPLFDEHGRPVGTLLTLSDIDERKHREADLRMRLATKEALVNLAELSLDAPDLEAILAESVRTIAEQLDSVLATVSWIDLERRELWVLAADGHDDDDWVAEMRGGDPVTLPERSLTASAVEHCSPVVVEDFRHHSPYDRRLAEHGVRSAAFVPLGDGQLVVSSLSRRPGASGASAVALIQSVARIIASYRVLSGEVRPHTRAPSRRVFMQPGAPNCGHLAPRRRPGPPRRPV
jgi:PAS domain S-box-containing protein